MTRKQEILLNAFVLATCGFGALFIDNVWSITGDRTALRVAASRALGLFLLVFPLAALSFVLVVPLVLLVPLLKQQVHGAFIALAFAILMTSALWVPILLGLYTLIVVAHGSAERNRILKFLGWFGGRLAAHLMDRRMWPGFMSLRRP